MGGKIPFLPGETRPPGAGRKKGTPNRISQSFAQGFIECDIDPLAEIADILPELEPSKRADVLLKLCDFVYPRRKAIDPVPEEKPPSAEEIRLLTEMFEELKQRRP